MRDYRQNPPTVEDINTHLLFTVYVRDQQKWVGVLYCDLVQLLVVLH